MRISKIVGNVSHLTLKCEIQFIKKVDWMNFYNSYRKSMFFFEDEKIVSDNIYIELPYRKESVKINYNKQYKNNNFNRTQLISYTNEKIIQILKDNYLNSYNIDIDDIEIQYDSKIPSVIKIYTSNDRTIVKRKLKIRKNELEN